jgi:hypothetical protein
MGSSLEFALKQLEEEKWTGPTQDIEGKLNVASFCTRNREEFQILLSSVLLGNEWWFKALFLIF